jgi:hypothetical protein
MSISSLRLATPQSQRTGNAVPVMSRTAEELSTAVLVKVRLIQNLMSLMENGGNKHVKLAKPNEFYHVYCRPSIDNWLNLLKGDLIEAMFRNIDIPLETVTRVSEAIQAVEQLRPPRSFNANA